MGWCSATNIFDDVAELLLNGPDGKPEQCAERVLEGLYRTLSASDWDCQGDSRYADHPIFIAIEERYVEWYEHRYDWMNDDDETDDWDGEFPGLGDDTPADYADAVAEDMEE